MNHPVYISIVLVISDRPVCSWQITYPNLNNSVPVVSNAFINWKLCCMFLKIAPPRYFRVSGTRLVGSNYSLKLAGVERGSQSFGCQVLAAMWWGVQKLHLSYDVEGKLPFQFNKRNS